MLFNAVNRVFRKALNGSGPELRADQKGEYRIPEIRDEVVFKFFKLQLQPPLLGDRHMFIVNYELEYTRVMAEYIFAFGARHDVDPRFRERPGKRPYNRRSQYG